MSEMAARRTTNPADPHCTSATYFQSSNEPPSLVEFVGDAMYSELNNESVPTTIPPQLSPQGAEDTAASEQDSGPPVYVSAVNGTPSVNDTAMPVNSEFTSENRQSSGVDVVNVSQLKIRSLIVMLSS